MGLRSHILKAVNPFTPSLKRFNRMKAERMSSKRKGSLAMRRTEFIFGCNNAKIIRLVLGVYATPEFMKCRKFVGKNGITRE